jgi:serine/threonine protein kinase
MSEIGKSLQKIALDNPSLKRNQMPSIYDYKKFKFMKDISTRYSLGKVLGQGAFGLVRYCTHKASGKEFAIKIMQKKQIEKQKIYV